MSERMVEIPVYKKVRDKIKERKGILSYDQFLGKIMDEEFLIGIDSDKKI